MIDELNKKEVKPENLEKISENDLNREMNEIFKRDTLFSRVKKSTIKFVDYVENRGINVKMVLIFISLIFLLLVFSIPIIPETVLEVYDKEVFNEKVDIVESVPKRISFGEIMMNMEDYDDKVVNITGHLKRYKAHQDSGIIIMEVLTDDLGNEINLKGIGEYNIFMPELGATTERFVVTGEFERKYGSPDLYVESVKPAEMEYINVTISTEIVPTERVIRREVVEPRKSIMKLLVGMI